MFDLQPCPCHDEYVADLNRNLRAINKYS